MTGEQGAEPPALPSLLTVEFLGTMAEQDEMSITRDLIAVARDRAARSQAETLRGGDEGLAPIVEPFQ
jgi:hypothetical protein